MADDKSKIAQADRRTINVNEDYEIAYWTKALGCTKDELKKIVERVGVSLSAVRKHLGK
ncbi:DUF3606 domain-containing protein [Dyadobacter sp. MSC1_007]|jgi:hypothetical protein|uniref:DUF3606 domain-containing protein n=1 Tax=Dyadobacter sp. MSC1_007 TaxID=2909264 RepID=UPI00203019A0|nr:DUF3606 domain-containing protein [Dyadobacter sp. MSC1_007]